MEKRSFFTIFCCLFFLFLSIIKLSFSADTITLEQPLADGETLISMFQIFELGFFSPGNSKNRYLGIWYKKTVDTLVWVANRKNPITNRSGVLTITRNGSFVLFDQENTTIWSSYVSATVATPVAKLLDSGNLVVRENSSSPENYLWQSFDHPSDTMLPGMKLGWNTKSGQETYLTSWRNIDDPYPGDFTFRLSVNGLPELVILTGSVKKHRSGPWDGNMFGGVPLLGNSVFKPKVVQNKDETYYMFEPFSNSVFTYLTLNQSGTMQRFMMYNWSSKWTSLYPSQMIDVCENYAQCGANGIRRANQIPFCECLKGFRPKSQGDWDVKNYLSLSINCEKKSLTLDCKRNERFLKLKQTKIPDLIEFQLIENMNLKQCETECFKNCSCRAYANLNVSGGRRGCLMWFKDLIDMTEGLEGFRRPDVYIRVPASELVPVQDSNKKKRLIAISVSITSTIFILALVSCISWKRTKRKGMEMGKERLEVPLFDFDMIATATNNFSEANKIGAGGFGPVYKGKLLTGQEIAVKRLSKNSKQGSEEFRNEVALIANLQHRNLVGLVGGCIQGEERMLIYEYMPNKSLDYYIFDHTNGASLAWNDRFKIVLGIARGILYLHQDSKLHVVHRDLKASNVLLDSNLNPKVSDFGLARIFGDDDEESETARVIGTYGYMSPEYVIHGKFSSKLDVFSLGVLLLEMVSGKRNAGFSHPNHHHNLLGHSWLLWREGGALELMDTGLEDSCVKSQALRCIHVGLLCVQKLPQDRPTMSSVVFMLVNEGVILPEPKQPGFFEEQRSVVDARSENVEQRTENEMTMTTLEAR